MDDNKDINNSCNKVCDIQLSLSGKIIWICLENGQLLDLIQHCWYLFISLTPSLHCVCNKGLKKCPVRYYIYAFCCFYKMHFSHIHTKGHSRPPWPQKNVHNFTLECLTIFLPAPFSYNSPSCSFLCMSNFNPLLHYWVTV